MKFAVRLSELRREKKFQQKYIGDYLGVSQVSVSNWERGVKEPNYQSLIDLSILFGVSCDYMLGLTNNRKVMSDN